MMSHDIARLLRDYRHMRNSTRELRMEMQRIAVEGLGFKRKKAEQANLEAFFDGYLTAQAMSHACRTTTDYEISGLLLHCQQIKKNTRELRAEMLRVAVEELGMEQSEALQANLELFLDGYLVGQGLVKSSLKC
jgi:hypothetical protein